MGKRLTGTPRSKVRAAIRSLYLRSRERAAALKNAGYCCENCGVKQSKAKGREQKVEVHHRSGGIEVWNEVIDLICKEILCDPSMLEVLCPDCHDEEHIKRKILDG